MLNKYRQKLDFDKKVLFHNKVHRFFIENTFDRFYFEKLGKN